MEKRKYLITLCVSVLGAAILLYTFVCTSNSRSRSLHGSNLTNTMVRMRMLRSELKGRYAYEIQNPQSAKIPIQSSELIAGLRSGDRELLRDIQVLDGDGQLVDAWRNALVMVPSSNGSLEYIGSSGPNGVWEQGKGDDVLMEIASDEEPGLGEWWHFQCIWDF